MHYFSATGLLVARVLLSIIFILSGVGKLFNYSETAAYMAAKGMPVIPFFLIAALIIEIIGGLSVLLGWKLRWGAALLFIYLIPVTFIMHDFWYVEGAARTMEMINFLKNLAIEGGLLYAMLAGAGRLSIDGCVPCSSPKT